jgi:hypothetical protein
MRLLYYKDGKTMYFTRNNYLELKEEKAQSDFIKKYKSTLENSQWINISGHFWTAIIFSVPEPERHMFCWTAWNWVNLICSNK